MKARLYAFGALLLLGAVAANCLGSVVARHSIIPLYLDSVLTIAVTALCGLWGGIACAALSNGVMALPDRSMLWFVACHICTAVFAHLTFRHHKQAHKRAPYTIETFLWAGLWSALSNAVLGNVIVELLYSSVTTAHVDNIVQGIFIAVENLTFATYFSGFLTNMADKMISAAISYAAYKASWRL